MYKQYFIYFVGMFIACLCNEFHISSSSVSSLTAGRLKAYWKLLHGHQVFILHSTKWLHK